MCVVTCRVEGVVHIEGRAVSVDGSGIFDHPRILLRENKVASFGWYLYSPVRFGNGTQLACYYSEDGNGERDSVYSAASLVLPGGGAYWLGDCNVVNLEVDTDGLPVRWVTLLRGDGIEGSLRMSVRQLPLLRGSGDADPATIQGKYVAYPLLMEVEGDARILDERIHLDRGSGIEEFLLRKGYQAKFP